MHVHPSYDDTGINQTYDLVVDRKYGANLRHQQSANRDDTSLLIIPRRVIINEQQTNNIYSP